MTKAADKLRALVRDSYAQVARDGGGCATGSGCCGSATSIVSVDATRIGYKAEDLDGVPEGANLGLGCGNPAAIAALKRGEVVLDLGSGAGFDCFLAAQAVGDGGHVIGVDMTPEMLEKARANAKKGGYDNVEFRLGEIEHLPVADGTVDVIISNCVLNLAPDKAQVLREAYRVLKPGGRLAVSDVVATAPLPEHVRNDERLYCGCVSGAPEITSLERMLCEAGFADVRVVPREASREVIRDWAPGSGVENYVVSAEISAVRPM